MPFKERDYPSLLKFIRAELGLSQEGLAREIGVSWASVNRWENGKVKPSRLALKQLKKFIEHQVSVGNMK